MSDMERGNKSEITFLVEDLEAVLEMNRLLEKENQELRNEVSKLKSQVTSLKAHDIERKSILWKKLQNPSKDIFQHKHINQVTEQKPAVSETPKKIQLQSPPAHNLMAKGPPPPPPPMPSKLLVGSKFAVKRVPEVIEFYRYLNKRNTQMEKRSNVTVTSVERNPRNMIGEIENRSTYLSAVKSEVATQREFINFLIREVETASFTEISAVEAFVKWVDGELSTLVDERAVLKHFPQWPERKADALREAACSYRDLMSLESEVSSYNANPKQTLAETQRQIQSLQDRLENMISDVERTREGTCKRYKEMQIPCNWMLDTGLVGQIKYSSLKLVKEYLKRIIKDLEDSKATYVEDIILHGARFAYRVHQFAGGFDLETKNIFEQLKRIHAAKS